MLPNGQLKFRAWYEKDSAESSIVASGVFYYCVWHLYGSAVPRGLPCTERAAHQHHKCYLSTPQTSWAKQHVEPGIAVC